MFYLLHLVKLDMKAFGQHCVFSTLMVKLETGTNYVSGTNNSHN